MKILGIVNWTKTDRTGHLVGGVIPLYEVTKTKWREIDRADEFPHQGQAFWSNVRDAVEKTFVFFEPADNDGPKDKFRVTEPHVALEVIDLRHLGDLEKIRVALVNGLDGGKLIPGKVLLWCGSDVFVGPVKLIRTPTELIKLEDAPHHQVQVFSNKKIELKHIPDGKNERIITASLILGAPDSYVDWDDDHIVARRALSWIADRQKKKNEKAGVTKKIIDEVAEYLSSTGNLNDSNLEQYRLRRLKEIFKNSSLVSQLIADINDAVRALPNVQNEIENIYSTAKKEAVIRAESELSSEASKLGLAKAVRQSLESENKKVEKKVSEVRAEVEKKVSNIELEVSKRLKEVVEKPSKIIAEIPILRALLGVTDSGRVPTTSENNLESQNKVWQRGVKNITEAVEVRRVLTNAFKKRGLAPIGALKIHAAVNAGLIPFVVGPKSFLAIDTYCLVACAARKVNVFVTPSFIEASQLFGRFNTQQGEEKYQPNELLSEVFSANKNEGIALAVIEGLNRGPAESYLLPLLNTLDVEGNIGEVLQGPLKQILNGKSIVWPKNLRIVATCVEGPTSLPISRDILARGVVIEIDECVPGESEGEETSSEIISGGHPLVLEKEKEDVIAEILENLLEVKTSLSSVFRYAASMSFFESDTNKLVNHLIETIILPMLVTITNASDREKLIGKLLDSIHNPQEKILLEEMSKRLRQRLL